MKSKNKTNTNNARAVVNPDTMTEEVSYSLVHGWFRGHEVVYYDFGANTGADGFVLHVEPIFAFFHSNGDHVIGQMNVIDELPGDMVYSDLWHVQKVIVGMDYEANSLRSEADIMEAAAMELITIEATDIYVNCPVIDG